MCFLTLWKQTYRGRPLNWLWETVVDVILFKSIWNKKHKNYSIHYFVAGRKKALFVFRLIALYVHDDIIMSQDVRCKKS